MPASVKDPKRFPSCSEIVVPATRIAPLEVSIHSFKETTFCSSASEPVTILKVDPGS